MQQIVRNDGHIRSTAAIRSRIPLSRLSFSRRHANGVNYNACVYRWSRGNGETLGLARARHCCSTSVYPEPALVRASLGGATWRQSPARLLSITRLASCEPRNGASVMKRIAPSVTLTRGCELLPGAG